MIQSSWGDQRNENLRENRLYGFGYALCMSWNIKAFSKDTFWETFFLHFFQDDLYTQEFLDFFRYLRDFHEKKFLHRRENFGLLWVHPFAVPKARYKIDNYIERIPIMKEARMDFSKTISQITGEGKKLRNWYNLLNLEYSAKLYEFFTRKVVISKWMNNIDEEQWKDIPKNDKNIFFVQIAELKKEILELKEEYQKLWVYSCSDANLNPILHQFDQMERFFSQKEVEIQNQQFTIDHNCPSKWIYFPQKMKKRKQDVVKTAFRKKIHFPSKIRSFFIQVVGDTHVTLYFNGERIGEFFNKRSLSVRMLNNLIKLIDLTDKIIPGENVLVIENRNYKHGFGIVNCYGEATTENGDVIKVLSDESWMSSQNSDLDEGEREFLIGGRIENIKNAKEIGGISQINGVMSIPDFNRWVPSHITNQFLGISTHILRGLPSSLLWAIRFSVKMAVRWGIQN